MQSVKDTFYEVLRARLAAVNPERTVVVRGTVRPAVVVEENELPTLELPLECFVLRWIDATVAADGALPMVALTCEVSYATEGSTANVGMDRGRVLGAMDADLLRMVNAAPQNAAKTSYDGLPFGHAAIVASTKIWWGDVVLGKVVVKDERVSRTATVTAMSYSEGR
jgi:hypothetical protein